MSEFGSLMLASFPPETAVPEPLIRYFDWIDAQGLARMEGYVHAPTDPAMTGACVMIVPDDRGMAPAWTDSDDPAVYGRLAPFCRTGGDGSYAALWRDDDGESWIVHLGSGSGSVMAGVLVDDAVDFLQLLAIGYDELCWPENHGLTPREVHGEAWGEEEEEETDGDAPPFVEPIALRRWVETTFGVKAPATANVLTGEVGSIGDDPTDDPFLAWLDAVRTR